MTPIYKRIITSLTMFSLLFFISSCSIDNLTKDKAETILNKTYMEKLVNICTLDKLLSEQPEFQPLKDERFCEARYIVTDIFYIRHDAVNVQYKIVTTPKPETLKKLLNAMQKLEERLKDSPQWKELQDLKQKVNEQLGKKELVAEEGKTNFSHYDFGWSVVGGFR